VLFNLAVAQPLFELLGRNPEFFVARQSKPIDVLLLALILSFGLPALLLTVEWIVTRISRRAGSGVQNLFLFLLAVMLIVPLVKKSELFSAGLLLLLSFLLAIAILLAYRKSHTTRSIFGYLSLLILIIPLLFLTGKSIAPIVHPEDQILPTFPAVSTTAPVVFMILDEFPLVSLLGPDGMIDASQYPNFARLQKDSVWFRNATTVADATPEAITGILTGKYPVPGRLPVLQDYPNNLFTMLAGSYDLKVLENISGMCPKNLNVEDKKDRKLLDRMEDMMLDLSAVYLHTIVPDEFRGELPSINETWGNFWQTGRSGDRTHHRYFDRAEQFQQFLNMIIPSPKPALYFQHILLPHVPWEYLPDGKTYDYRGYGPMGVEGMSIMDETWINDDVVVERAYQRHLLQVGYVDRMIGQLVDRLKSQNLYDRSLILITADHGASFRSGDRVRSISPTNYHDILPVPVIMKLPGQKAGRVIDRNFETIDILPTIADALGIKTLFETDGISALRDISTRPKKKVLSAIFTTKKQWQEFEPEIQKRDESVSRKIALFGTGMLKTSYEGQFSELEQLKTAEVAGNEPTNVRFELKNPTSFENVDLRSNFVPVFIVGRAFFSQTPGEDIPLGIWVNGVFRGSTRTFQPNKKDIQGWFKTIWLQSSADSDLPKPEDIRAFGLIVPESSYRQGKNVIQVVNLQNWFKSHEKSNVH